MAASTHGPPIPAYIFRGHNAAIHALHFFGDNGFFASGDSDGWIVIWRLTTRRPAAAWRAHEGGVSGIKDWEGTRLISHGRDHKLRVWQVREDDFEQLSTKLPVDSAADDQGKQPWLVHSMDVNALNFCAFAICADLDRKNQQAGSEMNLKPMLIASPNGLDSGGIDIFQLPSEKRVSKLQSDKSDSTGMVMALRIFHQKSSEKLTLVAGYEDGRVAVFTRKDQNVMPVWVWERLGLVKAHTQPVLSLDVYADSALFISSSADANLSKYIIPEQKSAQHGPEKTVNTKHAGQQDLKIRSDGRILATAGWDKHIRVYSVKTLKELAVLQWHQEGCYALAFAAVLPVQGSNDASQPLVEMDTMQKMKLQRDTQVHNTHWLAAGSKDGKISLWNIY